MISYREFDYNDNFEDIKKIYKNENWTAYLQDDFKLKNAFKNSIYLLGAFDNEKLIGFIRCVGDCEHIVLVQDLIVDNKYKRKGIGTKLLAITSEKYSNVRMFCLITDINDNISNTFYQNLKMKKLEDGNMISYFR